MASVLLMGMDGGSIPPISTKRFFDMINPKLLELEKKYLSGLQHLWIDSGCKDEELRHHILQLRKIVKRLFDGDAQVSTSD